MSGLARKLTAAALCVLSAVWVLIAVCASPMAAMLAGVAYTAVIATSGHYRENHDRRGHR